MSNRTTSRRKVRPATRDTEKLNTEAAVAIVNETSEIRAVGEEVVTPGQTPSVYTDVVGFLRILIVNAWIILLVTAIGTAAAYLYARSGPEVFRTDGRVMIASDLETSPANLRDQLAVYDELNTSIIGTYVQILRSRRVRDAAHLKLQPTYDETMLDNTEVEITPTQNSTFITVEVRAGDEQLARDMVNALVEAAIESTPQSMLAVFPVELFEQPYDPSQIAPTVRMTTLFGAAGSAAVGVALAFLFDAYRQTRKNRRPRARA